jgi:hypothetical protein
MSSSGASYATGYLMLALHWHGPTVPKDLVRDLLPVLESKSRAGSLAKDEAFILSEIYQHGIGCQVDPDRALELTKLSQDLLSQFRQEPEMKSREKLISLHLQLLEHSVKCAPSASPCSSKNCQKMKVCSLSFPLSSLSSRLPLHRRISCLTCRPAPLGWRGGVSTAAESPTS